MAAKQEQVANGEASEEFALTIQGGVSLGSYQAGYNWGFLRYLKLQRLKELEKDSNSSRFNLRSVTGASAGGINTLLSAITWCQNPTIDQTESAEDNLFHDTWIPIGLERLFPEGMTCDNYQMLQLFDYMRNKVPCQVDESTLRQLSSDPVKTICSTPYEKLRDKWQNSCSAKGVAPGNGSSEAWRQTFEEACLTVMNTFSCADKSLDQIDSTPGAYSRFDALLTRRAFLEVEAKITARLTNVHYQQGLCTSDLPIGLTLTRARPAELQIELASDSHRTLPVQTQRFVVPLSAKASSKGLVISPRNFRDKSLGRILTPVTDGSQLTHATIVDLVEASSAFPLAFGPKSLSYWTEETEHQHDSMRTKNTLSSASQSEEMHGSPMHYKHFVDPHSPGLRPVTDIRVAPAPEAKVPRNGADMSAAPPVLIPHDSEDAGSNLAPHDDDGLHQGEQFMDGGVFDNVPLGLAMSLAQRNPTEMGGTNQKTTVVLIDPSSLRSDDGPRLTASPSRPRFGLDPVLTLLGGAFQVAQQYELQTVARFGKTSYKGIVPRRSSRFHSILGNQLIHFGAFTARVFREYDYQVGIYDSLYDLAEQFCLKGEGSETGSREELLRCRAAYLIRAHDSVGLNEPRNELTSFLVRRLLETEIRSTLTLEYPQRAETFLNETVDIPDDAGKLEKRVVLGDWTRGLDPTWTAVTNVAHSKPSHCCIRKPCKHFKPETSQMPSPGIAKAAPGMAQTYEVDKRLLLAILHVTADFDLELERARRRQIYDQDAVKSFEAQHELPHLISCLRDRMATMLSCTDGAACSNPQPCPDDPKLKTIVASESTLEPLRRSARFAPSELQLFKDPQRWLTLLGGRLAYRLAGRQEQDRHIGVQELAARSSDKSFMRAATITEYALFTQAYLWAQGLSMDPSSIPNGSSLRREAFPELTFSTVYKQDNWGYWQFIAHGLPPYQLTRSYGREQGETASRLELGWEPSYAGKEGYRKRAIALPLAVGLSFAPQMRGWLSAGLAYQFRFDNGTMPRIDLGLGGRWEWAAADASLPVTPTLFLNTYPLYGKFRLGVTLETHDTQFKPDTWLINLGIADLNGLVYRISRLIWT